jgi:hypothetical protein
VRAKVELPFHVLKNLFRHRKTRYRGLAKTPSSCSPCLRLPIWCWLAAPLEVRPPEFHPERQNARRNPSKLIQHVMLVQKLVASLPAQPVPTRRSGDERSID